MKTSKLKKFLSFTIAVMIVISMCFSGFSVFATANDDGSKVIYLKTSNKWNSESQGMLPRFAAFVFNSTNSTWYDMTDDDGDGYYGALIPVDKYDQIIFTRMNSADLENAWTNKWNQTTAVAFEEGMNCYTPVDGYDVSDGTWSYYTPSSVEVTTAPTEPVTEEPITEPVTEPAPEFEMINVTGNGNGNWLNGCQWDPTVNIMTEISENVYQIEFKNIPQNENDFYAFRFVANGNWSYIWGGEFKGSGVESDAVISGSNIKFDVPYEQANVTITFDLRNYNSFDNKGAKFTIDIVDVSPVTLNFVIPKTTKSPKCWDNGIYLAYSDDYQLSSFNKIQLIKTDDINMVDVKTDSLVSGAYSVYSAKLSEEQIDVLDASPYVVLMNNSGAYRTYINKKYNIFRAPVGAENEAYNKTQTSVKELEGYTFVVDNEVELGTSIQGYGTFTGYWTNEPEVATNKVQVVVPATAKWKNCWKNGVCLAYGNSYDINYLTRIGMEKTDTYVDVQSQTDQLISGSYAVYTVELTDSEAMEVNNSKYVVFMDYSGAYRTYVNANYNIYKATNEFAETYGREKSSVKSHCKDVFVVCGGIKTGTSIEGYGTFTGYWKQMK